MNPNSTGRLRSGLGKFATGVTVVTCPGSGGPFGVTANSFSSVSLDPPLILWNLARVTKSAQVYRDAQHFAVNVLGSHQQPLAVHFARTDHASFDGIEYTPSASGVPILAGTIACFECRTYRIHDGGDHWIIVGEVEEFRFADGDPLLFFAGRYERLK